MAARFFFFKKKITGVYLHVYLTWTVGAEKSTPHRKFDTTLPHTLQLHAGFSDLHQKWIKMTALHGATMLSILCGSGDTFDCRK